MAISADSNFVHKVEGMISPNASLAQFSILEDRTHEISQAYNVYNPATGFAFRGMFFIDPQGVLRAQSVYTPSVGRSTTEMLRVLQALQYHATTDRVTQADWHPGLMGLLPQWEDVGKY